MPEPARGGDDALREVVRRYAAGDRVTLPEWCTPDRATDVRNERCGDAVTVYRGPNGAVRLVPRGCAILRASAALANRVADRVDGAALGTIAEEVLRMIETDPRAESASRERPTPPSLAPLVGTDLADDLAVFRVLAELPGRRRCATLPWEALRSR